MKKIYLLILLVVSMSFGLTVIGNPDDQVSSDGGKFKPIFRISTQRSLGVNGFKVYVYFSNDKQGEWPTFRITNQYGADTIYMQPKSSHVYRVVMDFSHKNIPANSYFPSNATKFFEAFIKNPDKDTHALRPYTWGKGFHNIVVESKDGEVLAGEHPNLSSRVGVLSKSSACKSGGYSYGASTLPDVLISLNSEKNGNASKLTGLKPNGVSVLGRDVYFGYCIYEFDELPRVSYDYAVFRMDDHCPVGSYPVGRHHDTEDSEGSNMVKGPLWPSYVGDNATLEFCFVPKDPRSTRVYPFDWAYTNDYNTSIFANVNKPNVLAHSTLYVDDENSGKSSNSWNFYGLSKNKANEKAIIDRIHDIMNGDENTWYHIVTRINPNLSKSAADVAESPISAGQPLVAAAPFAPAIKGLNRSAVSVELKSEGKVKVSIVNANGSVIANVAQESLQPGVHQIKWNSGMVPSGRYIVKVEQNGMVNARNVILK